MSKERDLRLTCIRADDVLGGRNIIQDVLRGMAESELIVVDVTNRNPNVFVNIESADYADNKSMLRTRVTSPRGEI